MNFPVFIKKKLDKLGTCWVKIKKEIYSMTFQLDLQILFLQIFYYKTLHIFFLLIFNIFFRKFKIFSRVFFSSHCFVPWFCFSSSANNIGDNNHNHQTAQNGAHNYRDKPIVLRVFCTIFDSSKSLISEIKWLNSYI